MQKIWDWLMLSSANPGATALTVKASLVGAATVFTIISGFAHVQVGDMTPLIDALIMALQALFGLVSAVMVVWGLVRKVILTFAGNHASVQ